MLLTAYQAIEIEKSLQEELHQVSLVGELELGQNSEAVKKARQVFDFTRGNALEKILPIDRFGKFYPASLVILFVADGVYGYEGGDYWSNNTYKLESDTNSAELGKHFENSLEKLDLEGFDYLVRDMKALRYVTPILLHGTIPRYCADDFWDLVLRGVARGLSTGDELIAYWRNSKSVFDGIDKPVERFCLYGGQLAEDYLDRILDLLTRIKDEGFDEAREIGSEQIALEEGIPSYFVEALLNRENTKTELDNFKTGARLPRPKILIDPYSSTGPSIVLPPTPTIENGLWFITEGPGQKIKRDARKNREIQVPLAPFPGWHITFSGSTGEIREYDFDRHSKAPVYFFDHDSFTLLKDHNRVRSDELLTLSEKSIRFLDPSEENELPEIGEFPNLEGEWEGFTLRRIDLRNVKYFHVEKGLLKEKFRVNVLSNGSKPVLITEEVASATGKDGAKLFASAPEFVFTCSDQERENWRYTLKIDGEACRGKSGNISDFIWIDDQFCISDFIPSKNLYSGELTLRGPLGADSRTSFTVVNGISYLYPAKVISPVEKVNATLSAKSISFNSVPNEISLYFEPGEDSLSVDLKDQSAEGACEIRLNIPRMLWLLRGTGKREFDVHATYTADVNKLTIEEIADDSASVLMMRVGRPSPIALELRAEGEVIKRESHEMHDLEGRWSFSLKNFLDSMHAKGLPRYEFWLSAGEICEKIIEVHSTYVVSGVRIDNDFDDGGNYGVCEVSWDEERSFKDRVIRIWSVSRPWDDPIIENVPDSSPPEHTFGFNAAPGPYIVEIAINDPWSKTDFPSMNTNCLKTNLGKMAEESQYRNSLDPNVPIQAVELVLSGNQHLVELENFHPETVIGQLFKAVDVLLSRADLDAVLTARQFPFLSEALLLNFPAFIEFLSENRLSPRNLRKILIALLPEISGNAYYTGAEDIDENMLEYLWAEAPIVAAIIDDLISGRDRWYTHTGWDPRWDSESSSENSLEIVEIKDQLGPPNKYKFAAPDPSLEGKTAEDINSIKQTFLAGTQEEQRPLTSAGFARAGLDLCIKLTDPRSERRMENWRSKFAGELQYDFSSRDPVIAAYLKDLSPDPTATKKWFGFFRELLLASLHLAKKTYLRPKATVSLYEASEISEDLVDWSILLAIAITMKEHNG